MYFISFEKNCNDRRRCIIEYSLLEIIYSFDGEPRHKLVSTFYIQITWRHEKSSWYNNQSACTICNCI
ncbi:hypothetical protein NY2A_b014R [Paramecium bursaria Chlorella virus NY2A]|uniref:Uncharacterized protein b014R n=1 Tax=Paramecium bursaria Chlorella virus NY2A TaxID=46021 RepID=A7IVN9_PBCVN|nr:hypothetical protein NY2A_b014R [Paramecium bursaria Chlorella virus NY2A]YP_001498091.1 hypothetical protein AR158_c009R [Paramecium bursaria Chlorella virus AR158]ABT14413.1 hypothetical protein NY2A_b014R [Paramecium bursaria Chlorella virus NY2A]ABU43555.1 hypothetical protein AR158_c009R [Paramecium bursaria Chlorella virus AR158]